MKKKVVPYFKLRSSLWITIISFLLFLIGIYLPFFHTEKFFFFKDDISLLNSISILFEKENYFLCILTILFSVITPSIKYILLILINIQKNPERIIHQVLYHIGKYSMTEVFALAVLITIIEANGVLFFSVSLRSGAVFFGLAVITSIVAAKKETRKVIYDKKSNRITPS